MSGLNMRTPTWSDIVAIILAKLGFRKHDRNIAIVSDPFKSGGIKPAK